MIRADDKVINRENGFILRYQQTYPHCPQFVGKKWE